MELWFTELEFTHKNAGLTLKIREQLYHEETQYQVLDIFDTLHYGKMMTLDGIIQLTELDEFFYHEMLVHVPMHLHPNPKRVLIIGGGDGGAAREVLRHKQVEKVEMVEIDEQVINISKKFFPTVCSALEDSKLNIRIADGIKFMAEAAEESFDVIIIDSSDPVGPAIGLFEDDFYRNCQRVLSKPGVLVAQGGTFWYQPKESRGMRNKLRKIFESAGLYWGITPTYPAGQMTYAFGCKGINPLDFSKVRAQSPEIVTKYYNFEIHQASFALPTFMLQDDS